MMIFRSVSPGRLVAVCAGIALLACDAGADTFGRAPVRSFGLEAPPAPEPVEDRSAAIVRNAARSVRAFSDEVLQPGRGGRVELFSISRLSPEDVKNPFEIRVHVLVDTKEIRVEIGGIVEGTGGQNNTAIIRVEPPAIRDRNDQQEPSGEDDLAAQTRTARGARKAPAGRKAPARQEPVGTRRVCSAGDTIEGFRVEDIRRDSVVLYHQGKYIEVPRGEAVTVCIPLSVL
ncbi:hypothetical protein OPIT5_04675 [Opitutaceae bacterium TAV5]|nr:hypothetical protein OPIT5_04675 [Opitutaceae bacterium TAV5]